MNTQLDTFLIADDIAKQSSLRCLACRVDLGQVRFVDHYREAGAKETKISVSLLTTHLTDFKSDRTRIEIGCECGTRSIFHMI